MSDDDLIREFEVLKQAPVPRRLDASAVSYAGRRRLRRIRTAGAGSFVALGLVGFGVVVGVDWSPAEDPAPAATPEAETPQWDTFAAAIQDHVSPDLSWPHLSGESDPTGTVDTMPLVDGRKAGYVAMVTSNRAPEVRGAWADLCDIAWHPMDPAGRDCEVRSGEAGRYAVLTFADSHRGRTVLVRVASLDTVVTVAQSIGWPHYPASEDTDPTLLPWDLRDALESESGEPGDNPERARLDELPLTIADQVEIAQAFVRQPPTNSDRPRSQVNAEPRESG